MWVVPSSICGFPHFLTLAFKLKNSWGESWGEEGYFQVSQQEAGQFGLFGILAQGVVAGKVQNTTAAVPDEPQDVPLQAWAIALIVLAVLLVGCVAGRMIMQRM